MNLFHKYTPLRIAVPFCAGIIVGINLIFDSPVIHYLLISTVLFAICLFAFYWLSSDYSSRWIPGLLTLLTITMTGLALVTIIEYRSRVQDGIIRSAVGESLLLCRLKSKPVLKTNSYAVEAEIDGLTDTTGQWMNPGAGVLIYFLNDSSCQYLEHGDIILMSGIIRTIAAPTNPDVFDYRQYLRNRQIRWQLNLQQHQWQPTGHSGANWIRLWSEKSRNWFLGMLEGFSIQGNDMALAAALLLGSKDLLEKDVRQEFSHAGAMHVLCVSGLHVGIMYVVAERLLFFMKKGRRGRSLQQLLILAFIWSYAFITGLSPSVMRAGLMFSLLAAGRMMKRSNINFNVLASAAFMQLLINPFEITQIGFQLSYLAVLGIFAFYQPLNGLFNSSGKIFTWTWSVMAVSIAAQASTSPLACHYFMLFPVYFLMTNLVVVPLAGIIIYLALVLALAGAAGFAQDWLALPLKLSLRLMHGSVEKIQSLPGSVIEPIVLDPWHVICLYVAMVGVFILFVQSGRSGAFLILAAVLLSGLISAGQKLDNLNKSEFIVYDIPGHSAIDMIHDRQAIFLHDSLLTGFPEKIDSRIKPHRLVKKIGKKESFLIGSSNDTILKGGYLRDPFLFYQGKKIAIIHESIKTGLSMEKISLDLLILSGNRQIKPEGLMEQFDIQMVVIDGSVPNYRGDLYQAFFEKANTPCHSVRRQGAFLLSW